VVWCARGVEYDIFTCAKSLDKLVKGIQEATCCHFSGKVKKGTKIKIIIHTETDAHSIAKTAQISGKTLHKLLTKLGYETIHQRGSHIQMRKQTKYGEHRITYMGNSV